MSLAGYLRNGELAGEKGYEILNRFSIPANGQIDVNAEFHYPEAGGLPCTGFACSGNTDSQQITPLHVVANGVEVAELSVIADVTAEPVVLAANYGDVNLGVTSRNTQLAGLLQVTNASDWVNPGCVNYQPCL